jgi:hypothetical protein
MAFESKTDREIDQWIENHAQKGQTTAPLYLQLLEERARRAEQKQSLKIDRSLAALKAAAMQRRCLTYGDLAKASGVDWSVARHQMNGQGGHLDRLLDFCHAKSLPLLTAICVNQAGVLTGELSEDALAGFVGGARRLGLTVTNELEFHHRCRDKCWAWGQSQLAGADHEGSL